VASRISSDDLFLNKTVTFPTVAIKLKIQVILCPSIDECLSCKLYRDNKLYRYFNVFKCLSEGQYINLLNI
jgi:hypothetical protein